MFRCQCFLCQKKHAILSFWCRNIKCGKSFEIWEIYSHCHRPQEPTFRKTDFSLFFQGTGHVGIPSTGGRSSARSSAAPVSSAAPKKKAFDQGGPVWPPRSNAKDDRLGEGLGGLCPPGQNRKYFEKIGGRLIEGIGSGRLDLRISSINSMWQRQCLAL